MPKPDQVSQRLDILHGQVCYQKKVLTSQQKQLHALQKTKIQEFTAYHKKLQCIVANYEKDIKKELALLADFKMKQGVQVSYDQADTLDFIQYIELLKKLIATHTNEPFAKLLTYLQPVTQTIEQFQELRILIYRLLVDYHFLSQDGAILSPILKQFENDLISPNDELRDIAEKLLSYGVFENFHSVRMVEIKTQLQNTNHHGCMVAEMNSIRPDLNDLNEKIVLLERAILQTEQMIQSRQSVIAGLGFFSKPFEKTVAKSPVVNPRTSDSMNRHR